MTEENNGWSAKSLTYTGGKLSFGDVQIPNADAAFALTAFCKKFEKKEIGFDFQIFDISIENKEQSEELVRSIMRFPRNIKYSQITLFKTSDEVEVEEPVEDETNSSESNSEEKVNPFSE